MNLTNKVCVYIIIVLEKCTYNHLARIKIDVFNIKKPKLMVTKHDITCFLFRIIVVPKFTAHPSNVIVNLESDTMSVSLTCEADGTTSYQWEREDGTIPSGATGVHTNTLTLVKLQSHDTGNYRCVASSENNISTPSKYATITIKGLLVLCKNFE